MLVSLQKILSTFPKTVNKNPLLACQWVSTFPVLEPFLWVISSSEVLPKNANTSGINPGRVNHECLWVNLSLATTSVGGLWGRVLLHNRWLGFGHLEDLGITFKMLLCCYVDFSPVSQMGQIPKRFKTHYSKCTVTNKSHLGKGKARRVLCGEYFTV